MLSDGHCHLAGSEELASLQQVEKIVSIINCESPEEYQQNQKLIDPTIQTLSYGIHPWKADRYTVEAVESYLRQVKVIGEIGLDNFWTKIPLNIQEPIFEAQLALAAQLEKPVVLHTKGCEKLILSYLRRYPNRYLVHWYSTEEYQEEYIELGCYFTIGVDVTKNLAVKKLAEQIPADRLLLESDGLEAVAWAYEQPINVTDYLNVLNHSSQLIGKLRQSTSEEIQALAKENLQQFLR